MNIENLRKEHEIVDLFCTMAEIPSPSLKEEKLAKWICKYCELNGIECSPDAYGNLYIRITAADCSKQPLLLSAHMDVIGDESPVNVYLDGDLIRAKGRTLGADDKAGAAQALLLAKELTQSKLLHGGLEVVLTRDEESGMSGIKNFDLTKALSKYVLVLDSHSLGRLETAGASYTLAAIDVKSFKGGHSGIDIADTERENAVKLIADIVSSLPHGVYHSENGEVVTSCNIGGIQGGDLKVTNVINTSAQATYSIRSSSRKTEDDLKELMTAEITAFNKEYAGVAQARITFEEHLPPFEQAEDKYIPILFETAAKKSGVSPVISTFHAGAETHIYANRTNSAGEKFTPYLLGTADIQNMHSAEENVDYKSMLKGFELLKALFEAYNS
ncbi:MAG: M20/M25/M40 family metallo-hydrolase [Heliobacteriaceae bacterium]|nr:M20/M25/M40 family metallo-hydrolase [Heliobacteriaceae bacterium]